MVHYREYMGWHIRYTTSGSQRWQASKNGVQLCANTLDLLKLMIRQRNLDKLIADVYDD